MTDLLSSPVFWQGAAGGAAGGLTVLLLVGVRMVARVLYTRAPVPAPPLFKARLVRDADALAALAAALGSPPAVDTEPGSDTRLLAEINHILNATPGGEPQ